MRFQLYEWSCGAACVSNALLQFGVPVPERTVIPVAGTTSPSKCAHCKTVNSLLASRTCSSKSYWKCKCEYCLQIRREWRKECDAGTSHKGILTALRHFGGQYGISAAEYESPSKNNAWQWIHGCLLHGRVVILCIDRWSHWVLAIGSCDDRVIVFDPYPSKKNKRENGILTMSKSELMRRWYNGCKWVGNNDKRLYALSLGKS